MIELVEKIRKKMKAPHTYAAPAFSSTSRGANSDQDGIGDKNQVVGLTDEIAYNPIRGKPVQMSSVAIVKSKNAPASTSSLQRSADSRRSALNKQAVDQNTLQLKNKQTQINDREKEMSKQNPVGQRQKIPSFKQTLKKMHEETERTGSEHPIAQARKAISLRGQYTFTHINGDKHRMDPKVAHKILAHHDGLKTSAEKLAYATRIHRSKESMDDALAGKPEKIQPKVSLAGKITGTQS